MRWLKRLLWMVVIIAGVWSGVWYAASLLLNHQLTRVLAHLREDGTTIACADQTVGGYPFRIGPRCANVRAVQSRRASAEISLDGLVADASLLDPGTFHATLTSPMTIGIGARRFTGQWNGLNFTTDFTLGGGFELLKLTAKTLELGDGNGVIKAASVDAQIFPVSVNAVPMDIQTLVRLTNFSVSGLPIADFPPIDLTTRVSLAKSYVPLVNRRTPFEVWARNGFDLTIDQLQLETQNDRGEDGLLHISGLLRVDMDGLVSGTLQIAIANPQALQDWAGALPPQAAQGMGVVTQAVSGMGKLAEVAGRDARSIEVRLDQGAIKLGFITLGQVPPLRF
ncbi:MAG: DUF2125 domain-containing protein [Pseudomonadota bacterium]